MGVILLNSNNNNHEQQRSLDEINNTINFNHNDSASQKFLAFLGPGYDQENTCSWSPS